MQPFIFDLLTIAQLSTGRRVSLYARWLPLLLARGLTAIVLYLDRARAHDLATKTVEQEWAAQEESGVYTAEVHELDDLVDQILIGIHDMVGGQMRGLEKHEPLHPVATEFMAEVFPAGPGAITKLAYVEQVTVVENIVTKLTTSLASHVDALGLGNMVARLVQHFPKYRQAVDAESGRVTFAQVREANRRGLAYMAEILVMILAEYHDSDDPAHLAARQEFLAPLMVQDARSRADWRARRRGPGESKAPDSEPVIDVEPDDQPADEQAAADERMATALGDVAQPE